MALRKRRTPCCDAGWSLGRTGSRIAVWGMIVTIAAAWSIDLDVQDLLMDPGDIEP